MSLIHRRVNANQNEYKYKSLEEIAEIKGGNSLPKGILFDGDENGTLLVKVADMNLPGNEIRLSTAREYLPKSDMRGACPIGTIVFPKRGGAIATNKKRILTRPALLDPNLMGIIANKDLIQDEYLYYWFLSFDLSTLTSGTTIPQLNRKDLAPLQLPCPSLNEQSRMVKRIKDCLSRIDEIRHLREESRQDAHAIESATFADFLEEAAAAGCPVVTLGDVLLKSQYGISAKASINGKGVPILRMGNIQSSHLDFSDLKHIDLSKDELKRYRLEPGDILINRTNSMELVGKSAMFEKPKGDWVFASYLVRLVIDRSKALPEFVNAAINSRIGRAYVYRTARRAIGMVNINAKEIAKMPLTLPSIEKQEQIVARLIDARNAAQSLFEDLDIESIKTLPSAVLRKAFAGEL